MTTSWEGTPSTGSVRMKVAVLLPASAELMSAGAFMNVVSTLEIIPMRSPSDQSTGHLLSGLWSPMEIFVSVYACPRKFTVIPSFSWLPRDDSSTLQAVMETRTMPVIIIDFFIFSLF